VTPGTEKEEGGMGVTARNGVKETMGSVGKGNARCGDSGGVGNRLRATAIRGAL
jgi:hypothetical protein